jgi:hypothetical protein
MSKHLQKHIPQLSSQHLQNLIASIELAVNSILTSLAKSANKYVLGVDAIGYLLVYHGVHVFHGLENPALVLWRALPVQDFNPDQQLIPHSAICFTRGVKWTHRVQG